MSKPIFTIMADYGGAYGWHKDDEGRPSVGACHADRYGWYGEPSISDELHQQFAAWQLEFEKTCHLDKNAFADFDWVDFNRRGIMLCHKLKA